MKRTVIEEQCRDFWGKLKQRIESDPIPAALICALLGVFFMMFVRLVVPTLILAGLVLAVIWFFAETDE